MNDWLRSADGRFRDPTPTEQFARQTPVQGGATGDLSWLDKALKPSRERARAVNGPVPQPEPQPPEPPEPAPPSEPSPPAGRLIPAGTMTASPPPDADLIRDALRRRRH